MQPMKQEVYNGFLKYVRKMLADLAHAHTGSYHNQGRLQEIVVVWNPAEKPLEGYPAPENITHIRTKPHINGIDCGSYVFKDVLRRLMEAAGYKGHDKVFISETKGAEFSCNMGTGCAKTPDWGEEDGGDEIYYIMLRSNRDLSKALTLFRTIDDNTLDKIAKEALRRHGRSVENERPSPVAGQVMSGPAL